MHKYPHVMAIGAPATAGPAKVQACSDVAVVQRGAERLSGGT